MNRIPLARGRIAYSIAGRDEGRRFIVIDELDADYVLIADGELHKVDRPKKKKRKHLRAMQESIECIPGRELTDQLIKRALVPTPEKEG
ncbi:MAG: KOW domain-containing RNA-binding protein [Clostridia bacterium]